MISAKPDWRHRALHLGALWAFAIGKPLLDSINESGFFLLPRSAAPADIVLLAVLVLIGVPALLLGIEQLVGLASERARDGLHLALAAFLAAVFFVQLIGSLGIKEPKWAVLLSLLAAVALTAAYARTSFLPTTLDVLGFAPVVFLFLFLFLSPSTSLWLPGSEPSAEADVDPASDPPIVFLILDEFPTGSLLGPKGDIDASLFPNFAELSKRTTWYENATTVADQTERAIPAIVSGQRQDSDHDRTSLPVAHAHPETMFTLLGGSYDFGAAETVTQLCPRSVCDREIQDGFAERFGRIAGDLATYTPAAVLPRRVHDRIFGMGSEISPLPPTAPNEEFDLLLDGIDSEPGGFDFLHASNLPHKPWTLVPSLQDYTDPADVDDALEHENDAEAPQVEMDDRKRHLLEVGAADGLVGEVMDRIDEQDGWDDTMLVVVADHGISFRADTGRRRASEANLDQLAFVPLFVKLPGQEKGGPDPAPAETIDIVPTIAKQLGVDIPWDVDGVPLGERTGDEVEVVNYRGTVITGSLEQLLRRRQAFVDSQAKLFDTGGGWNALIESGPGSELVGTQVPAELPDAEGSADVILSGREPGQVDAVVAGRIHGLKPGIPLAIAVDGRIESVTKTVATTEGIRYEAVLPRRVYEGDVGEVQVLQAAENGGFALLGSG